MIKKFFGFVKEKLMKMDDVKLAVICLAIALVIVVCAVSCESVEKNHFAVFDKSVNVEEVLECQVKVSE